jgi:hypothetical protein
MPFDTKNLPADMMTFIYQPTDILINLVIACILGLVISFIYKTTHKGLSYSQSFMLTTVFVTVIVAMVMMVIGNNLARAFALVGALSIIRFRTVIKDTKDTAYVFLSLAAGMAAGTSSYFLALAGVVVVGALAYLLHITNYGSLYKSEFLLRFRARSSTSELYDPVIREFARSANLLHVEPSGDEHQTVLMTYDIVLNKGADPETLSRRVADLDGLSEVTLIASKSDVDY